MDTITALPTPPSRDDPANFDARADVFLPALVEFGEEVNALAEQINAAAAAAAASAATAINAPGTTATSTSSLTIGTGGLTLSIQSGKNLGPSMWVTIANTPAPANWMTGFVTAYDSGTGALSVNVMATGGAGTFAAWTVAPSAPAALLAAAAADLWTGTSNAVGATPAALIAAAAPVTIVDGATITPNLAAGFNFMLAIGGNRTLANPATPRPGQSGVIGVIQDGTGGRTLTRAAGSYWKFPGGVLSLSTAPGAVDLISYFVLTPTVILCTLIKAFG